MSDSIPPNKAAAVKPQGIVPIPSPKYPVEDIPRTEKVEGPETTSIHQAQTGDRIENWNTKNLLPRLATDALSAGSAAVMVAPLITIIDK